jgi:hypothetical protein
MFDKTIFGMKVVISPDIPKYVLPEEVMPGVPWPPGFRDEMNRWALSACGVTNLVPRGTAYVIGGKQVMVNPLDAKALIRL